MNSPEEPRLSPSDAELPKDADLAAVVAYDDALRSRTAPVSADQSLLSIDPELARTLRCLNDVLRPSDDPPSPHESFHTDDSGAAVRTEPSDRNGVSQTVISAELPTSIPGLPDRFQLQQELGRGNHGIVYRAHDTQLDRDVAIKILRPEFLVDETLKNRFLQESRAAARLNHPSIVRVLEANHSEQLAWQVSELVTGAPLAAHLIHQPRLPERLAARLLRDLSDAVHHAHSLSVLHRDIKPENVLLDRQPGDAIDEAVPRLVDFGLARMMDANMRLSVSGLLVGTPRYMAPEQLTGSVAEHCPGTDVYSLGVLLYELLAGEGPFHTSSGLSQRIASLYLPVPRLSQICPGISRDLATICHKCLEPAAADRYLTAADLRDDLQRFLDGRSTVARPLPMRERWWRWSVRNPASAALIAVALLALLIVLGVTLRTNETIREQNEQLRAERDTIRQLAHTADALRSEAVSQQLRFQKLAWTSGIREAYAAWEHQQFAEADQALERLRTAGLSAVLRPEWQLLRQQMDRTFRRLLTLPVTVHEIRSVPGTAVLAVAAADGRVYLVDVSTTQIVRQIDTGIPSLHALAVSPDGLLLATGGATDPRTDTATACVYSIESGKLRHRLPGQPTTIESLEFSADGQLLAVGARYENVQVFRLGDGHTTELPAARRHRWLAGSADGRYLTAQVSGETILLADFADLQRPEIIPLPVRVQLSIWLPDSSHLMNASHGSATIQLFDLAGRSAVCEFVAGMQQIESMAVTMDQRLLLAGLDHGDLVCWAVPDGITEEAGPEVESNGQNSPPDTLRHGSAHIDTARHKGGEKGLGNSALPRIQPVGRWHVFDSPVTSVAVVGEWLVASSFSGEVIATHASLLADAPTTAAEPDRPVGREVTSATWSADGRYLLLGDQNGAVVRMQAADEPWSDRDTADSAPEDGLHQEFVQGPASGRRDVTVEIVGPGNGRVSALAVAPVGESFVWARAGEGLFLQTSDRRRMLWKVPAVRDGVPAECVHAAAFSPDGRMLAWTGSDAVLHVLNLASEQSAAEEFELPGHGGCLAWTPDGNSVICGGQFGPVILVDLTTRQVKSLVDYGSSTHCIHVTSGADQIITGHPDGTVRFLRPDTGVRTTLHLHALGLWCIALSADGSIGVSIDDSGGVGLWFARTGERIGMLQESLPVPAAEHFPRPAMLFAADGRSLQVLWKSSAGRLNICRWRWPE
ncbi:MAG: serine/threonine-protein kinase [Fuerstiella sp.]